MTGPIAASRQPYLTSNKIQFRGELLVVDLTFAIDLLGAQNMLVQYSLH